MSESTVNRRIKFLSTPSSQRATACFCKRTSFRVISIHALFAEGDKWREGGAERWQYFYPRPLRRGRQYPVISEALKRDFYPRPLRRGRQEVISWQKENIRFLSTPSSQRATCTRSCIILLSLFLSTPSSQRATSPDRPACWGPSISIHALFAEGDMYNPSLYVRYGLFLSTPSSQRATISSACHMIMVTFLSTPSSQRATQASAPHGGHRSISIHALFAEGDEYMLAGAIKEADFYPRPLRRGRRFRPSIHAIHFQISIHALFAEGDTLSLLSANQRIDFYPRPLRRGRRTTPTEYGKKQRTFLSTPSSQRATVCVIAVLSHSTRFLSTPSSQRATLTYLGIPNSTSISIHALFAEGDIPRRRKLFG